MIMARRNGIKRPGKYKIIPTQKRMRKDRPSNTALSVSVIRTVHQLMDELPHILDDPVSPALLRDDVIRKIRKNPDVHRRLAAKTRRSHVVLRSRYAEDQLSLAVEAGIHQFVNLGAGYDTFVCRQPSWARNLRIVEMDYPATQAAKIEHFRHMNIQFPEDVDFQPLDLENENLSEGLARTKISLRLPTFIACLGVLVYLQPDTVRGVFQSVAQLPRGSRLVFTFASEESRSSRLGERSPAGRAAALGEPWLAYFSKDELQLVLTACGFNRISFLSPEKAASTYYYGRNDLPVPRKTHLCTAIV
jgi:methyltransferase (TIGR00027 family)